MLGFLDMQGYMVIKWAGYVAKSESKSKLHGPNLLLQSCMPVVFAQLKTGPQIDGNLCEINEKTA